MKTATLGTDVSGNLFAHIIAAKSLKNDAALARFLEISPVIVSKIRHGRLSVGPSLIIRIHEATDMPVALIKSLVAQ